MKVTLLGCGSALSEAHQGGSATVVQIGRTTLLVDCGSGTLQKLAKAGVAVESITAILLTHAHLDHWGDLASILFALRMPSVTRQEPLWLVHSQPFESFWTGLQTLLGDWLRPACGVKSRVMRSGDTIHMGDIHVRAFPVSHHETSLGYRLRAQGASLVIPADTGPSEELVEGCKDADCVLLECSLAQKRGDSGHLGPEDVIDVLRRARPKAALLTHLYPEAQRANVVEKVQAQVDIPVALAREGLVVEVRAGGASWPTARAKTIELGGSANAEPATPEEAPPSQPVATRPKKGAAGGDVWPPPWLEAGDPAPGFESRAQARKAVDRERFARELMDAQLAGMDGDAWSKVEAERKQDPAPKGAGGKASAPKVSSSEGGRPSGPMRAPGRWSMEDLKTLRASPDQLQLLKEAGRATDLPEINLHGQSREDALTRLKAAVQTWVTGGQRFGRVITGKGKHSQGDPVVKLAALSWLEGTEALRWVTGWAPEIKGDGNFGSLVVALRHGKHG